MHRLMVRVLVALLACSSAFAIAPTAASGKAKKPVRKASRARLVARKGQAAHVVKVSYTAPVSHQPVSHLSRLRASRRRIILNPWTEPTFANSTSGDKVDGEDVIVRRAAVQALGPYNGSIVAVDPQSGRILALVNQKLAFRDGFEPCSTIKLVAAIGGLNEGVIDRTSALRVGRRTTMNLTMALARSNNYFFAQVGDRLGFDKVTQYAKMCGLGEKAGFEIPEEEAGTLPSAPPAVGGVGMMTTFGSGIHVTPLQLASLVGAMANGGTLYFLQHPRSPQDVANFTPRVKRQLNIANWIPEIKPGMEGAVEYGTARRASYDQNQPIFGKTGTCSDERTPGVHLGWFASFNEVGNKKLVVVVLLTGGGAINGPVASGVAGAVYRNLSEQGYFGSKESGTPVAFLTTAWPQ